MKRKVRVKIKTKIGYNKVVEKEYNTRDFEHFDYQRRHRANIFIPKKGKGSYKRKDKFQKDYRCE